MGAWKCWSMLPCAYCAAVQACMHQRELECGPHIDDGVPIVEAAVQGGREAAIE